mgnify:CR=1 FL=1
MNEIYVITCGTYSNYGIHCIFSKKKEAEKYFEQFKLTDDSVKIEVWPLDTEPLQVAKKVWITKIKCLKTGEFIQEEPIFVFYNENERVYPSEIHISKYSFDVTGKLAYISIPRFYSLVSQERANKLAIEARQDFIRHYDINKIQGHYYVTR